MCDQTIFESGFRVEDLGCEDHLLRPSPPDEPGKTLGPASPGNDPKGGLGQSQSGIRRGDPDVAGECELQSSAKGNTIDGRDDRLVEVLKITEGVLDPEDVIPDLRLAWRVVDDYLGEQLAGVLTEISDDYPREGEERVIDAQKLRSLANPSNWGEEMTSDRDKSAVRMELLLQLVNKTIEKGRRDYNYDNSGGSKLELKPDEELIGLIEKSIA